MSLVIPFNNSQLKAELARRDAERRQKAIDFFDNSLPEEIEAWSKEQAEWCLENWPEGKQRVTQWSGMSDADYYAAVLIFYEKDNVQFRI